MRVWLAGKLAELTAGGPWEITLATVPTLSGTHTIQIGHAAPTVDSFRRRRAALPVVWWVNEANEEASVADLYAALSFAQGSVIASLNDLDEVKGVEVLEVGEETFGPTGFLRASTTVTVKFDESADGS